MSYAVTAYATDLGRIRQVLGSGDASLVPAYLDGFAARELDVNEIVDDELADRSPALTIGAAARQMIMGGPYRRHVAHVYGELLEFFCDFHGTFLDNNAWSPVGGSFIDDVSQALASAGAGPGAPSMGGLMRGGAPVPLPPIVDFPFIGFLERDQVPPALDALARADLDRITEPSIRESAAAVISWLRECHGSGRSLVCFYQ